MENRLYYLLTGAKNRAEIPVKCPEKNWEKVLTQRRGVWYYNKAVRDGEAVLGRARTLKIEQHLVLERTEALEIF